MASTSKTGRKGSSRRAAGKITEEKFLNSLIEGGFPLGPDNLPVQVPPTEYANLPLGGLLRYSNVRKDPRTGKEERVYRSGGILIEVKFPKFFVLKNPYVRYDAAKGAYGFAGSSAATGPCLRPTWTVGIQDPSLAVFYRPSMGGGNGVAMLQIKNSLEHGQMVAKPADKEERDQQRLKEQAKKIKILKAQLAASQASR